MAEEITYDLDLLDVFDQFKKSLAITNALAKKMERMLFKGDAPKVITKDELNRLMMNEAMKDMHTNYTDNTVIVAYVPSTKRYAVATVGIFKAKMPEVLKPMMNADGTLKTIAFDTPEAAEVYMTHMLHIPATQICTMPHA